MENESLNKIIDLNESIPDRDVDFEKTLNEELYDKYVNEFVTKIELLEKDESFVLNNSFNGLEANHHIMYKYKVNKSGETLLMTADGCIGYEFLVEFDKKDPQYGIYYGCRGHIKAGDQKSGIDRIKDDWENLRDEVTAVLNNTFVDKDFSNRFQPTNNANNKTYWPFWISLGADEDVIKVAARATKLICNVYKKYLNGWQPGKKKDGEKKIPVRTRYTKEAYQDIIKQLKDSANNDSKKGEERVKAYKLFIKRLEENCHISVDDRYEKCWKFRSLKKVEVHYLIEEFCNKLLFKDDAISRGNPWRYFSPLFLSKDEMDFCNIRTSTTKKGQGYNSRKGKTLKKVNEVYEGLKLSAEEEL